MKRIHKAMIVSVLLFVAFAVNAGEVVSSACGGWFAVDSREVKTSTFTSRQVVGGNTGVILTSSPNAWGENDAGSDATITWENNSQDYGTVAEETDAETVLWTPEAVSGIYTLTFVSGNTEKHAAFIVNYPETECTVTTSAPVPYSWLDEYFPRLFDYEECAKTPAANTKNTVEECFVAGLDPTDFDAEFLALIGVTNGLPYVSWAPELSAEEAAKRVYRKWGKVRLADAQWTEVAASHEGDYNFFKVSVEMR